MALHELTTNAVKYGALGQEAAVLIFAGAYRPRAVRPGSLSTGRKAASRLPNLPLEQRGAGNGRRLIEDALPYQFGARTTFAIEPDGVHCTIALPLS